MLRQSENKQKANKLNKVIFVFRNIALLYLILNTYNHFKIELNFLYLCITIIAAVTFSIIIYKCKLRLLPAIIILAAIPFIIRGVVFFFINLIINFNPIPESDILFLYFDINFYPFLILWGFICLFNTVALRFPGFIPVEIVFNVFILLLIFITEINYHIKLMHPTIFAVSLAFFIIIEISILYFLNRKELKNKLKNKHSDYKQFLIYIPMVLLVLLLIFIFVIKKYNEEMVQTGGGLLSPTLFRFDFASYITLQSEIEQSDELVMLYRKNGHAERMLLRRFVLSDYKQSTGFIQTLDTIKEEVILTVPDTATEFNDPEYLKRSEINQEYFIVNFDPNSLLGLNYPVRSTPIKNWDSSSFIRIYSVDSKISTAAGVELREVLLPFMDEQLYDFYTEYGNDEIIREFTEQITEVQITYYDKVIAIRDYLKNNYLYSLKPGIAEDGNQLHHFLFNNNHLINNSNEDSRFKGKGYCSYFAFAMTLMARSIGIPARVAVGFLVLPNSSVLNFYEIREYQAHAWVEIYFNDYGWIEFNPTSEIIAPGEEFQLPTGPDWEVLYRLIEEILSNDLIEDNINPVETKDSTEEVFTIILNSLKFIINYWYFSIPFIYIFLMFTLKYYHFIAFKISKLARAKIKYLYYHSLIMLRSSGIKKNQNESLLEFSVRIQSIKSIKIKEFTNIFLKAVFSKEIDNNDLHNAIVSYNNFKSDYKKNIFLFFRIAGFLNPFNPLGVKK